MLRLGLSITRVESRTAAGPGRKRGGRRTRQAGCAQARERAAPRTGRKRADVVMRMRVGAGEMAVSNRRGRKIETGLLGSGVAVAVHDARAGVGGVLHFILPSSMVTESEETENPLLFCDTGVARLLEEAKRLGAGASRLEATLAGGVEGPGEGSEFAVGRRNCLAARQALESAGVRVVAERVGGYTPSALSLDVGSGRASLTTSEGCQELWSA